MAMQLNVTVNPVFNNSQFTAAGVQAGSNFANGLNSAISKSQPLGRITGQVSEFEKSMEAANARVLAFGASAGSIYLIKSAFDKLFFSTVQVEKALADINAILGVGSSLLKSFSNEIFKAASFTGQTFETAAKVALEFARQGAGAEEAAKRMKAALELMRISGLNADEAVNSITSSLNAFSKEALTAEDVVNRLTAVDTKFAVSSKDLANALQRVGAVASDAGIQFNELLGLVTAAQTITARGGAVIGNAFKSIFTRLARPQVLDDLEAVGVTTRNASGQILPMISVLKNLANQYNSLGSAQKSFISESVGGVYQVNILKAALADLGDGISIFDKATIAAGQSTGLIQKRMEELNETISSKLNTSAVELTKLFADLGQKAFGSSAKGAIDAFNKNISFLSNALSDVEPDDNVGEQIGKTIAQGIVKGIGGIISGPGVQIAAVLLTKMFSNIGKFAIEASRDFMGANEALKKQESIVSSIQNFLSKNPTILQAIKAGQLNVNQAHLIYLQQLQQENQLRAQNAAIATTIATNAAPYITTSKKQTPGAGYIPNFAQDESSTEKRIALNHGYAPGPTYKKIIHDGKGGAFLTTVNGAENIYNFTNKKGYKATMVVPPNGFGENTMMAGSGFIPNFAKISRTGTQISNNKSFSTLISGKHANGIDTFSASYNLFTLNETNKQIEREAKAKNISKGRLTELKAIEYLKKKSPNKKANDLNEINSTYPFDLEQGGNFYEVRGRRNVGATALVAKAARYKINKNNKFNNVTFDSPPKKQSEELGNFNLITLKNSILASEFLNKGSGFIPNFAESSLPPIPFQIVGLNKKLKNLKEKAKQDPKLWDQFRMAYQDHAIKIFEKKLTQLYPGTVIKSSTPTANISGAGLGFTGKKSFPGFDGVTEIQTVNPDLLQILGWPPNKNSGKILISAKSGSEKGADVREQFGKGVSALSSSGYLKPEEPFYSLVAGLVPGSGLKPNNPLHPLGHAYASGFIPNFVSENAINALREIASGKRGGTKAEIANAQEKINKILGSDKLSKSLILTNRSLFGKKLDSDALAYISKTSPEQLTKDLKSGYLEGSIGHDLSNFRNSIFSAGSGFLPNFAYGYYSKYSSSYGKQSGYKPSKSLQKEKEEKRRQKELYGNYYKSPEITSNPWSKNFGKDFSASGFLPNFGYLKKVMGLEKTLSGKEPILDTTTGPFPFIRNTDQPNFAAAVADHGGLKNALKDSSKNQKAAGIMAGGGFIPNFGVEESLMLGVVQAFSGQLSSKLKPLSFGYDKQIEESQKVVSAAQPLADAFDELKNKLASVSKQYKEEAKKRQTPKRRAEQQARISEMKSVSAEMRVKRTEYKKETGLDINRQKREDQAKKFVEYEQKLTGTREKIQGISGIASIVSPMAGGMAASALKTLGVSPDTTKGVETLFEGAGMAGQALMAMPNPIGIAVAGLLGVTKINTALNEFTSGLEKAKASYEREMQSIEKTTNALNSIQQNYQNLDNILKSGTASLSQFLSANRKFSESMVKLASANPQLAEKMRKATTEEERMAIQSEFSEASELKKRQKEFDVMYAERKKETNVLGSNVLAMGRERGRFSVGMFAGKEEEKKVESELKEAATLIQSEVIDALSKSEKKEERDLAAEITRGLSKGYITEENKKELLSYAEYGREGKQYSETIGKMDIYAEIKASLQELSKILDTFGMSASSVEQYENLLKEQNEITSKQNAIRRKHNQDLQNSLNRGITLGMIENKRRQQSLEQKERDTGMKYAFEESNINLESLVSSEADIRYRRGVSRQNQIIEEGQLKQEKTKSVFEENRLGQLMEVVKQQMEAKNASSLKSGKDVYSIEPSKESQSLANFLESKSKEFSGGNVGKLTELLKLTPEKFTEAFLGPKEKAQKDFGISSSTYDTLFTDIQTLTLSGKNTEETNNYLNDLLRTAQETKNNAEKNALETQTAIKEISFKELSQSLGGLSLLERGGVRKERREIRRAEFLAERGATPEARARGAAALLKRIPETMRDVRNPMVADLLKTVELGFRSGNEKVLSGTKLGASGLMGSPEQMILAQTYGNIKTSGLGEDFFKKAGLTIEKGEIGRGQFQELNTEPLQQSITKISSSLYIWETNLLNSIKSVNFNSVKTQLSDLEEASKGVTDELRNLKESLTPKTPVESKGSPKAIPTSFANLQAVVSKNAPSETLNVTQSTPKVKKTPAGKEEESKKTENKSEQGTSALNEELIENIRSLTSVMNEAANAFKESKSTMSADELKRAFGPTNEILGSILGATQSDKNLPVSV
jgi:TP901 family phage tail tape measure protein